jgi:transcription elongation factor Elf1
MEMECNYCHSKQGFRLLTESNSEKFVICNSCGKKLRFSKNEATTSKNVSSNSRAVYGDRRTYPRSSSSISAYDNESRNSVSEDTWESPSIDSWSSPSSSSSDSFSGGSSDGGGSSDDF